MEGKGGKNRGNRLRTTARPTACEVPIGAEDPSVVCVGSASTRYKEMITR